MHTARATFFKFLNELAGEFFTLVGKHGAFWADLAQAYGVVLSADDAQALCFTDVRGGRGAFALIFLGDGRKQFLEDLERSTRLVNQLGRYFVSSSIDRVLRVDAVPCPITRAERFLFNWFSVRLFRVLGETGLQSVDDVKGACVACVGSVSEGPISLYLSSARHDEEWRRVERLLGEQPDIVLVPVGGQLPR